MALPAGEYVVYQRLVSGSTAPNMDITDEQQLQNLSGMSINPVRLVLDEAQTVFVRVTVAPKGTVAKATSEPVIIPASLWGGGGELVDASLFPSDDLPDGTVAGVTFVNNHDGTITVSGQSTGAIDYDATIAVSIPLEAGWYTMTGSSGFTNTTVGDVSDDTKYSVNTTMQGLKWLPKNTYNAKIRRLLSDSGDTLTVRPVLIKVADGPAPTQAYLDSLPALDAPGLA